jgi:hypothetical protein
VPLVLKQAKYLILRVDEHVEPRGDGGDRRTEIDPVEYEHPDDRLHPRCATLRWCGDDDVVGPEREPLPALAVHDEASIPSHRVVTLWHGVPSGDSLRACRRRRFCPSGMRPACWSRAGDCRSAPAMVQPTGAAALPHPPPCGRTRELWTGRRQGVVIVLDEPLLEHGIG